MIMSKGAEQPLPLGFTETTALSKAVSPRCECTQQPTEKLHFTHTSNSHSLSFLHNHYSQLAEFSHFSGRI